MKFLQDYKEQKQSDLFDKTFSFFAFSEKQVEEGKKKINFKDGEKLVFVGAGLFCKKGFENELIDGLEAIEKEAIEQDLQENGIEGIIKRELWNYECDYTGDISRCAEALEDYPGITKEMIREQFLKMRRTN